MIRLGIVGSDNSHADRYGELCNLDKTPAPDRIRGARVVAICGRDQDPKRTNDVATNNAIPLIVDKPEDLIGRIDAALVVYRHGDLHARNTVPLLQAGIPTFVDKPFALKAKDAERMIEAADKSGTLLTSFSPLRFAPAWVKWKKSLKALGALTAGVFAGPAQTDSVYGGLGFYGVHCVELMQEVFGLGVQSIYADEVDRNVLATVAYGSRAIVAIHLLGNAKYVFHTTVYGEKGMAAAELDSTGCYPGALRAFLKAVRTGKSPVSHEQMLEVAQALEALKKAHRGRRRVQIH